MKFIINTDMKNLLKYTSIVFAGLFIFTTACIDENFDDSSDVGFTDKELLLNVLIDENQSGELSSFLALVEEYGLTGDLTSRKTQEQRTVFAPTNNAFEILAAELGFNSVGDLLSDNTVNLQEILETHVALANLSVNQIENGTFRALATLSGVNIPIARGDGGGFVLNANEDLQIIRSNDEGNGTVHVISRVIVPISFNVGFSEDFGSGVGECTEALQDWRIVNVVLQGGSGWACTNFGFEGQGIQANGFDSGAQEVDSWIISPVLESGEIVFNTLKFKYASRFDGPDPEIWVISEDDYDTDGAFDMEAWTELDFTFPAPAGANNIFTDQSVSIPGSFNSGSYRFAFRYLSGAGATRVTIDNIQVGEE